MLDTNSLLLVSILQKAYPLSPQPSAEMFLHHFAFEIDRTCGVLKSLGLVEKASSTIDFAPTRRLIDLITDRMVQTTVESKNAVAKSMTTLLPTHFGSLVPGMTTRMTTTRSEMSRRSQTVLGMTKAARADRISAFRF